MSGDHGQSNQQVCSFSFKKRKAAAVRRKRGDISSNSSDEGGTVVMRSDKKHHSNVLSAQTVNIFLIALLFTVLEIITFLCLK